MFIQIRHSRMNLTVALLFALVAFGPFVRGVEDGIYEKDDAEKKVELKFIKGEIKSTNNDNTDWHLVAHYAKEGAKDSRNYFIVLNGKTLKMGGGGSDDTGYILQALLDPTLVEAAKKTFGFEVVERKKPDYRISAKFSTDKVTYQRGEEISVTIVIKNESDQSFYFGLKGDPRDGRNQQFIFSGDGPEGAISSLGPKTRMLGATVCREIASEKEFSKTVLLKDYGIAGKVGHYSILVRFPFDIYKSKIGQHTEWQDQAAGKIEFDIAEQN